MKGIRGLKYRKEEIVQVLRSVERVYGHRRSGEGQVVLENFVEDVRKGVRQTRGIARGVVATTASLRSALDVDGTVYFRPETDRERRDRLAYAFLCGQVGTDSHVLRDVIQAHARSVRQAAAHQIVRTRSRRRRRTVRELRQVLNLGVGPIVARRLTIG